MPLCIVSIIDLAINKEDIYTGETMSSIPPRTRTRKAPAERAAEIIAAATAIARENGLSAVTLRAVAERVGVASGLVAHYEPSMDELVARVYAALVGEEVREVERLVASAPDPAAQLAALFGTLMEDGREDLTVVWVEGWAMARRNVPLAAAVREQMQQWQTLVEGIVAAGCRTGEFATTEPGEVAWQLIGMIDGLNAQSLARGTDTSRFAARTARAAEALVGAQPGAIALRAAATGAGDRPGA